MAEPQTVELETGTTSPKGSVIWLHGLGADGHDFEPIVGELGLPDSLPLRFVFPHAPVRPVTINGGMSMRAWYDIMSLEREGPTDAAGIRASSEFLTALIRREVERGIGTENIVVAGFSQGGALAMHTALRYPQKLAGLMALSSYLLMPDTLNFEVVNRPDASAEMPIFMAHGMFDTVLPMQLGRSSSQLLLAAGYPLQWHEYPMAHAVCADEIADIQTWLCTVFAHLE